MRLEGLREVSVILVERDLFDQGGDQNGLTESANSIIYSQNL
ncbi:MAG: hypothetical protein SGJ20_10940 [Planctomycetota bacterium]|nr:hypothetical protein [Planctomycetota bacterium]